LRRGREYPRSDGGAAALARICESLSSLSKQGADLLDVIENALLGQPLYSAFACIGAYHLSPLSTQYPGGWQSGLGGAPQRGTRSEAHPALLASGTSSDTSCPRAARSQRLDSRRAYAGDGPR